MEKFITAIWWRWEIIKHDIYYMYLDLICYHEYKHIFSHLIEDSPIRMHALFQCVKCKKYTALPLAKIENKEVAEFK